MQRLNQIYTSLWLKDKFPINLIKIRLSASLLLSLRNHWEYIWWYFNPYFPFKILRGNKAYILHSCLLDVLYRPVNIMADKGFNIFDRCAAIFVRLFSQEEESSPLLPEVTVKCTHMAVLKIHKGC